MTAGPGDLWMPRFLPGVGAYFDLMGTSERLLYADHARYIWSRDICGPSVKCMWRVDQVSPVGCTSIRIAAILGYE
jgi:hypothetical protein